MMSVLATTPTDGGTALKAGPCHQTTRAHNGARHHSRRAGVTAIAVAVLGLSAIASAGPAGAVSGRAATTSRHGTRSTSTEPFAGDVYQVGGNGNLISVDPRATPDNTPLFNLAGEPVNVTWGQWRATTASSVARPVTSNNRPATDFRIAMGGLIPGGTYSLFYRTFQPDSGNLVCPTADPLIELTALRPARQHPGPASFVADSAGRGRFAGRVAGDLLAAQSLVITVIYDFSGQTFGPVPNLGESLGCRDSFGQDSMQQLLILQK